MCFFSYYIYFFFFFFNDTPTTEIYTLSLHDALPICHQVRVHTELAAKHGPDVLSNDSGQLAILDAGQAYRSEEHTSELQSQSNLVCRLLLEKKKKKQKIKYNTNYLYNTSNKHTGK